MFSIYLFLINLFIFILDVAVLDPNQSVYKSFSVQMDPAWTLFALTQSLPSLMRETKTRKQKTPHVSCAAQIKREEKTRRKSSAQ